jgi:hypothetical protein
MGLSAFKFEETKPVISNDELLADLRAVAASLGADVLPQRKYRECGHYSTAAIKKRFGTWNAAVVAAGLGKASLRDIPSANLFENLRDVWTSSAWYKWRFHAHASTVIPERGAGGGQPQLSRSARWRRRSTSPAG